MDRLSPICLHSAGNSSFPLCVGLAVLLQLRAQLMEAQVLLLLPRLQVATHSIPFSILMSAGIPGVVLQPDFEMGILQFNECILLFSDMPAVDIDNVVSTSMEVLRWKKHW